jgi:hypothetical protein
VGAVDESAESSASYWSRIGLRHAAAAAGTIARMHLRPPSVDHGVQSGAWALGLGLFIFFGLVAIGVAHALALIVAAVSAGAIFIFVRLRGEDPPGTV